LANLRNSAPRWTGLIDDIQRWMPRRLADGLRQRGGARLRRIELAAKVAIIARG
jgi:hypothetical protein